METHTQVEVAPYIKLLKFLCVFNWYFWVINFWNENIVRHIKKKSYAGFVKMRKIGWIEMNLVQICACRPLTNSRSVVRRQSRISSYLNIQFQEDLI